MGGLGYEQGKHRTGGGWLAGKKRFGRAGIRTHNSNSLRSLIDARHLGPLGSFLPSLLGALAGLALGDESHLPVALTRGIYLSTWRGARLPSQHDHHKNKS